MKTLLTLFVLFFSSSVFADDISDFEIEGMSIGDSALDFFTKEHIKKNTKNYYKDKTYTPVQNNGPLFFETYDAVDFNYKTNDKKYIIQSLSGVLFYNNNIKDCYPKMDEIIAELKQLFRNSEFDDKETLRHPNDPEGKAGKTRVTIASFYLKSGSIDIACYDYSEKHGSQDHLNIAIQNIEFGKWLTSDAYK